MKMKVVLDEKEQPRIVEVPVDADGQEIVVEKLEEVPSKRVKEDGEGEAVVPEDDKKVLPIFTDEEYLIASPVVLGFAFAEKLWLEFTVSGVKDITWNEGAYDSLVLEDNTKAIVKVMQLLPNPDTANMSRLSLSPTNTTQQKALTMSSKARARVLSLSCMVRLGLERPSPRKGSPNSSNVLSTWSALASLVPTLEPSKPNYKRFSTSHMHGVLSSYSTKQMSSSRSARSKISTATPWSLSSCVCSSISRVFCS